MEIITKYKGLKSYLPTKDCPNCKRPFQYRKKWKDVWSEIIFCSKKCSAEAKFKNKPITTYSK